MIAQIIGEWNGVALDGNGAWSDTTTTVALNTSGINQRFASMLGTTTPTARFIIDTSRNGHGPLNGAQYAAAPYNQPSDVQAKLTSGNWCNPPGAGLGLRPTANTGVALVDAYLWVKIPGESDGSCDIAGGARAWDYTQYNPWSLTGDAQNHFDCSGGWSTRPPASGSRSRRCSWRRTPCRRSSDRCAHLVTEQVQVAGQRATWTFSFNATAMPRGPRCRSA